MCVEINMTIFYDISFPKSMMSNKLDLKGFSNDY